MMKKILLVEDHDDFRETVRIYLETQDLNTEIFEASSGERAIEQALKERPDIILMDIRLPDITGIEAASRIKKILPECRIIILTMFETEAFRSVLKTNDVAGYVGKSELYEKLLPQIKGILNHKEK